MNFQYDVFISYAHIDNLPLKEGEKGWVESFHRALEVRLAQLLGERPQIWRDQKLQGNDLFNDEIVEQFPKTAVMISIVSPRYIKSEWCTKELKEFCQKAAEGTGVRIANKSRIFKVIKTAVPFDSHPEEIADTLGYEFYVYDSFTGRVKELAPKAGGELEQNYWARLDDIAQDICGLLEKMKQTGEPGVVSREEQLTVYLAETGADVKDQHDMIKRELMRVGYRVVPDSRLPLVGSEFKGAVENFLDQSVLSIHLVGGSYSMVPEGSKDSIIALQNQLAAKKSKTGNLRRLIWLLPECRIEDERQEQFIQRLRTDDEALYGSDMFETSIEDFKYAIHDKLNEIKSAETTGTDQIQALAGAGSCVYLAQTNYDLKIQGENIKKILTEQGYKVLPEQPPPLVYSELIKEVDNLLNRCEISIHLLGEDYGVVPDKTDKSVIHLEYERAAEKSKKGQLRRLVRLSPVIHETDERQCSFIESIKANVNAYPYDDIFETPGHDIGPVIAEKIRKIGEEKRKNQEVKKEKAAGPPLIYLICDRMDVDNITELEDVLYENEFDVMLPAFEGQEEALVRDHRENLKTCDAVMIYYGEGDELWMRSITRDLTKIAGYGRERPLALKAVFLAAPASRQKERFRSHSSLIINGTQGFSPALLEPFIEILRTVAK
jgi:hypothetical protein